MRRYCSVMSAIVTTLYVAVKLMQAGRLVQALCTDFASRSLRRRATAERQLLQRLERALLASGPS